MTRRKKWYLERMKADIWAMRNMEMGSYKASRVFNLPQQHYGVRLKAGRKAEVKQ
jgi:hypothetical protein